MGPKKGDQPKSGVLRDPVDSDNVDTVHEDINGKTSSGCSDQKVNGVSNDTDKVTLLNTANESKTREMVREDEERVSDSGDNTHQNNEECEEKDKLLNTATEPRLKEKSFQIKDSPPANGNTFTSNKEKLNDAASLLTSATEPFIEEVDLQPKVRTYKRRWFTLLIFCLMSMCCGYQWIHLSIIGNIVIRYYDDSLPQDSLQKETAVDWLSMIYFLTSLVTFLPVLWVLDFKGLRVGTLIAATLTLVGTWLKVAAVNPDLFPLLLAGQTLCGLGEVYLLPAPPRLAAVWFGPDQVSTACSFGVLANQVGIAIGFLLPPVAVPDSPSLDTVGANLRYLLIGGAVYSTLIWLLVIFAFRDKPPSPPSHAEYLIESRLDSMKQTESGFLHSLRLYRNSLLRLLRNRNFLLLMISYGLCTGSYYAVSTLLNNMILSHHPGGQTSAGQIGLTIVFAGLAASLMAGLWLDKTKTFKPTTVGIYAFAVLGMVSFTFTLNLKLWTIFITAGALGFFMTGLLPVAYQFAAEITYPEPEGSSSGLLTASAMSVGIVMTLGMRAMMNQVSILAANIFVSCMLLLGTILAIVVQPKYMRQEAENSNRMDVNNYDMDIEADKLGGDQESNGSVKT